MAQGDLILRISASLKGLQAGLKKAEREMKRSAAKLESIGSQLSLRVSAPIAAIGVASVRTFAQFDKLEKGLAAISGSSEKAKEQFAGLQSVVADTRTSLDLQTAARASLQLQGVGTSAEDAARAIKALGIAATLSGAAADDVGEVARQFSQATAKGQIMQEELSVALERLPALAGVINREFGTVTAEGLRKAGVSATDFINRLVTAIEQDEKFQNVQGGLAKSFETFTTSVQIAGAELGKTIVESIGLEEILNKVSDTISKLVSGFSNLSPATKTTILGVSGLAAAIGPLSLGLGSLLKVVPLLSAGFSALLSPIGLLAGALALAGVAYLKFNQNIDVTAESQKRVNDTMAQAKELANQEKNAVDKLIDTIKDENTSKGEKAKAIDALKQISPEYFGQLDVEKSKTQDLVAASDQYNSSLQKRQALQALNERSLEIQKRLADVNERINKSTGFGNTLLAAIGGNLTGYASGVGKLAEESKLLKAELAAIAEEANKVSFAPEIDNTGGGGSTVTTTPSGSGAGRPTPIAPVDNLDNTALQLGIINSALSETKALADSGFVKLINEDIDKFSEKITTAVSPLSVYGEALQDLEDKNLVFGDSFNLLQEQIAATESALNLALEKGLNPFSTEVEFLKEQLAGLTAEMEKQEAAQKSIISIQQAAGAAFSQVASDQVNALQAAASAAKSAARDFVKAKVQEGVSAVISKTLGISGPFGLIAAGAAGAAAAALFNKVLSGLNIPALAEGGITTGPTLALIGEGRENEVVLPLSKLNNLLNSQGGTQELVARIEGEDLYFLIQRVGRTIDRIG